MAQRQTRTKDEPALIAVSMDPITKSALSIDEIARALTVHLEGTFHSYRHRYASEAKHQQVQLETIHETKEGQKFRVITEYDESLTIVDLVNLPETH